MTGRRALLLFMRTAAVGLMNMLTTAIVARLMGAEVLGTIGYLMSLLGTLTLLSDLGYSKAYVKRAAERDDTGDYTSTFLLIQGFLVAISTLTIVIVPAVGDWQNKVLSSTDRLIAYYLIGLFHVAGMLFSAIQMIFLARLEAARMTLTSLTGTFLATIAKITAACQGWGLIGLSGAFALEKLGGLLVGLVFMKRHHQVGCPKWSILKDFTAYVWPQMALIVSASFVGNLDRVLLGHLGGTVQVGYYVGMLGLLAIPRQLMSSAMRFFFPRVSRDAAHSDYSRMRQRLKGALKYLLLIIVPIAGLLIIVREPLVRIYLGPDFSPAASVAAVLALTVIPNTIILPYQQVIFAVEQHRHLLAMNLLGLAVLIVASSVLIPTLLFGVPVAGLGALGAAIAVLLKDTTQCLCVINFSVRRVGIGLWKGMLWFLLGGSLMVGVGLIPLLRLPNPDLFSYALAIVLGLSSYLVLLYAVGQLRKTEMVLLWNVVHPLKLLGYIRSELGTVRLKGIDT